MTKSRTLNVIYRILVCASLAAVLTGCAGDAVTKATDVPAANRDFSIFWPPRGLGNSSALANEDEPLLLGDLSVFAIGPEEPDAFRFHLPLRRPRDEPDRIRWNSALAFPEYSWMAKVRVWDCDEEWLWPNLPYLLRAHGQERIQRYGGVDPGKGIDNDFAAVLARPLEEESSETSEQQPERPAKPLVSAEWYPGDAQDAGRRSVVHVARSDDFTVRLTPKSRQAEAGRLGVWLIYADFLGASVPPGWPANGEYDGGILAYFEVEWHRNSAGRLEFDIQHLVPPTDTGFDWAAWSTGRSALEKNLELVHFGFASE